jgi:Ni/Co efflux regulator RcnB
MTKLLSMIIAAVFMAASVTVMAQDKKGGDMKKPTAEQCKKDPKMKGCEPAKK